MSTTHPTPADYDDHYFRTLYGSVPRQTVIDRGRDALIHSLAMRFGDGRRLLEVGCGFGYLLERFDRRWQLCGTDISPQAVAAARRRLPHAHIVVSDIGDGVPFRSPFDVVLATNVIEHLPEPERAADHLASVVRPGGVLVLHLPTINNAVNRWIYNHSYAADPTHVYRPSGADVNRLFKQAGFRTVYSLYSPFWPASLWRMIKLHPAYLAVYERTV